MHASTLHIGEITRRREESPLLVEAEFLFDFLATGASGTLDNRRDEDHELALIATKVLRSIKRKNWIGRRIGWQFIEISSAVIGD